MEPSALSLLPPVVLIALAILTRRILLSLGVGIALGALMASGWSVPEGAAMLAGIAAEVFYAEGEVTEESYILVFVLMLGALTTFIYVSGGLRAFAEAAVRKVRTRFQAQFVPILTGIIIFFDDAFSSLVGGNVSRPITDRHRISRAKLSYFVDSTAAPVIVLTPISGWAVFIAATLTPILADNDVTAFSGYEAYLLAIPANLYAITALLFVFAVAWFQLDFGPMRRWEERAVTDGTVTGPSGGPVPGEMDQSLPIRDDGKVADLVAPVVTLIGVTVAGTVWIGVTETDGPVTATSILANTNVILALFFGGLLAVALAGARLLIRRTPVGLVARAGVSGIRSMLMAAVVLFCAWVTAEIMSELGIGEYLATLIDGGLAVALLPVLIFILASGIAFSIGSTFGTFGLLLPIVAEIAVNAAPGLMIPMFGAVLAGAIFGDHTSPLSDTTILSAIGSGIHLIDHVTTQMPYALVASLASAAGFVTMGLTENVPLGLAVSVMALAVAVLVLRRRGPAAPAPAREAAAEAATEPGPQTT